MNPAILLHVYNEQHPIHCKIPSNHCTIDTITALFLAKDYLNIFISTDGTIVRHISLYSELDDILNLSIHSIYYSVNTIVEGGNQPGSSNSEGQTFDRIELAPFEEKTIPALPRDYIALENFFDLFRQDIKVDCTVTPSVPKHMIQSLIDAFIEGYPVYMETNENDMQQVVRVYNKADFTCANGRYFILYKLERDYQPVPEKFYCNAEATGSSEDRCETHCIECIKYEKGMGSETFIAKWNKHIKGTSYPVAGDDKPTWLRITENLDVGGAAVMYDRDNPNVPLVYTIDEFHALGMAPSNKLDKFCMVHVMDNEFLSKHVIDTPSDKSNIDLYNMDLHERIDLEDNLVWVLRVPGGWVYESVNPSTSALASVFVPFNNEFQQ